VTTAIEALEITTLGVFGLRYKHQELAVPPTKKARALLAYLVMNRETNVAREQLLERFWPDFDSDRARDNLKVTLWSVRRCFRGAGLDPDAFVRADRSVVRWIAPVSLDVDRFVELCASPSDLEAAQAALGVYRGDFIEGDLDDWTVAQRERLAALFETALSRAAAISNDVGAAEALIARNPYDEAAYATLAAAELGAGRPWAAALLAQRCRTALAEVGTEPSAEFIARFGSLRSPDESGASELRLPFVARESELGLLDKRFADACENRGSTTIVHGDAGIGKSSLLRQAIRLASTRGMRVVELACRGRETQTLGEWEGLFEQLTASTLAGVVAAAGFQASQRAAHAMSAALDGPAALVIDDAHLLSGESFALLCDLVARAGAERCIVIGTRPEGLARLRASLHERLVPTELRLDCLSRRDVDSALRQVAGGEVAGLASALFDRTKGHPLYVVELLASLVDDGTLSRGERGWQVHGKVDEALPLPASLRSFIEARLTARGSVPAMVASALSIETSASATELRAALNMDEAQLLDALDDLLSLGLIVQPETGAQFAFFHDVVAEVALAMLNAGRRVRLHAAFARSLQGSADRDAPMRAARHFRAAGEPIAAASAFLKAAGEAQERGVSRDAAIKALEGIEAVDSVERSAERDVVLAELHRVLAVARLTAHELDASLEAANAAVTLAREASPASGVVEALLARATIAGTMGRVAEQSVDASDAAAIAERTEGYALRARSQLLLAEAARANGRGDDAASFAREAYETAKNGEHWDVAARACAEMILTCSTWWNFQEAQRWVSSGKESALRAGSAAQAIHYAACSVLWYLMERLDDAQSELRLSERLARQSTTAPGIDALQVVPSIATFTRYMAGVIALRRDNAGEALAAFTDNALGNPSVAVGLQSEAATKGFILAALSRHTPSDDEAARAASDALPPDVAPQSVLGFSTSAPLVRACVAARRRDPDAFSALRQALDAAEGHARRTPLEADVAFARLSNAARETSEEAVAVRAAQRAEHYRAARRAAAGAAWGSTP